MGVALLPRLRQWFSADWLVVIASLVFALTLLTLAYIHTIALVMIALVIGGIAWISMTSSFNIAVQLSVPDWVQARALGTYQMVFQGSLAVGSALWGFLAESIGISTALSCAAIGTFVVESWIEHLRQHERVTVADRAVREQVVTLHQGDEPPIVSHLIYAR